MLGRSQKFSKFNNTLVYNFWDLQRVIRTLTDFIDLYDLISLQQLRNDLWPRITSNVELLRRLNSENNRKKHQYMSELTK